MANANVTLAIALSMALPRNTLLLYFSLRRRPSKRHVRVSSRSAYATGASCAATESACVIAPTESVVKIELNEQKNTHEEGSKWADDC